MAADDTYISILDQRFTLEVETIEDTFESSIARHEFPYRDGALLEDMGQKARVIRIRCYFLNDNYEAHKDLVNYLGYSDDLHELQHPEYGLVKGKIESIIVQKDDRLQTAEVDLTYVENLRGVIDPEPATSVAADVEAAFETGQAELTAVLEADMRESLGADAAVVLDTPVEHGTGLYEQFSVLTGAAQAYVRAADAYVKALDARLRAIANPANGLVSVIDYAANLPGRVARSIAHTVERYAVLAGAGASFPVRIVDNFLSAVDEICDIPGVYRKHVRIAAAQRSAHLAATIFKQDRETASRRKQAGGDASFSPLGRRLSQPETERILTINEMEQILSAVRARLQGAIDLSRNMPGLKNMAETLTDHVRQMKLERPAVITVEVDNTLPLHLVCLEYGLTTADAEQLMTINRIRNPNFVTGKVNVYAR